MTIKITTSLKNIIEVHQRIITALKAQQVRNEQLSDNYQKDVEEECKIPSNRYLHLTRLVNPYMSAVITSKILSFELNKQLERFVKEVVNYEVTHIITEAEINELEYGFDRLLDNLLNLEKKYLDTCKQYERQIQDLQSGNVVPVKTADTVGTEVTQDFMDDETEEEPEETVTTAGSENDDEYPVNEPMEDPEPETEEIEQPKKEPEKIKQKEPVKNESIKKDFSSLMNSFEEQHKEEIEKVKRLKKSF